MPLELPDNPYILALQPLFFLLLSTIIALPQLFLQILLHPFQYVFNTMPLPERVHMLRSKVFWFMWRVMSPVLDPKDTPNKAPLCAKANGVVLEVGAGVGDNIKYYVRSQVKKLILVEPNLNMHPALQVKAHQSGYFEQDGSLLLLGCGAAPSDESDLAVAGVGPESVDSIVSIHVLCGIPNPDGAVELYRTVLKPGGLLVFFEHVRSDQKITSDLQSWYTRNIWQYAFDGCALDRPTGAWIMAGPRAGRGDLATGKELAVGVNGVNSAVHQRWSDFEISSPHDQKRYTFMPHVMGWAVKA